MVERITISFEISKPYLLNMFEEGYMSEALEKFFKGQFSSWIEIYEKHIKNNMQAMKKEIQEEKIQQIAFEYVKSFIEKEDLEKLQIEAAKAFFKESFTNQNHPKIAIERAFETIEVISISEDIQKKIRNKFILISV